MSQEPRSALQALVSKIDGTLNFPWELNHPLVIRLRETRDDLEAVLASWPPAPPEPEKTTKHYVGCAGEQAACGRQKNTLSRGGAAYEWHYVTCADCLATRASALVDRF